MESEGFVGETTADSNSYSTGPHRLDISSEEFNTIFAVDPSQAWYWSTEWQEKEAIAAKNLAGGRYKRFNDVKEFIEFLDSDEN